MKRRPAHPRVKFGWNKFLLLACILVVLVCIWRWYSTSVFISSTARPVVVFNTEPVALLILPKEDLQASLVFLSQEINTVVPYGYGKYSLGAMSRLAEIEKKPTLFLDTIEDLLALKINAWVSKRQVSSIDINKDYLADLKSFFSPLSFFDSELVSNLSFGDKLYLSWVLFKLRAEKVSIYDTTQMPGFYSKMLLPNGDEIWEFNISSLDELLQNFTDVDIRREALTVAVKNATNTAQVGQKFSRFLKNLGTRINLVGNESLDVEHCLVRSSSIQRKSAVVEFLIRDFRCSWQELKEADISDVVVYVGDDFAKRWPSP